MPRVKTNAAGAGAAGANAGATRGAGWFGRAAPNLKQMFRSMKGNGAERPGMFGLSLAPEGFDWAPRSGVKAFGKNLGTAANIGSGVVGGLQAVDEIGNAAQATQDNSKLMDKIQTAAMGNPLLNSYLTSEQMDMLGAIQRGSYDKDASGLDDFVGGAMGGLKEGALGALGGFLTGGIPGAAIGGGLSLLNSGLDARTSKIQNQTSELQSLYQALMDAEMQYKAMRRPNFPGLGIQSQYQQAYM